MNRKDLFVIVVVIVFFLAFPFVLAELNAEPDHVFVGFLLNPIDGASYLAKMQQGWAGSWQFTLPFTAERSQGAYLFLYYIFLGHLARWFGLPILLVFHLARLVNSGILLFSLFIFLKRIFPARPDLVQNAFILAACGSGMGWLPALVGGYMPFDFYVAEAYPFLSMYSNPHFPLGLCLFVLSIVFILEPPSFVRNMKLCGISLAIAIVYPFGQVLVVILLLGWSAWVWIETRQFDWLGISCLGAPGGFLLLYQFYETKRDPFLAAWNAQNITLTPPGWDVVLSLSPALLFALIGGWWLFKHKGNYARHFLILWPLMGLVLAYFPVSIQRRFAFGIFLPLAILAVYGNDALRKRFPSWGKKLWVLAIALSLPTNMLILSSGLLAVQSHPAFYYLTKDEVEIIHWIDQNTPQDAVILASQEISFMIPAICGRRVVYAHPYETANAGERERDVISFYRDPDWSAEKQAILKNNHVDYIIYGPREAQLGKGLHSEPFRLLSQSGNVRIFSVVKSP